MNEYQETVSRLQQLKSEAVALRDRRISVQAQLDQAVRMREELLDKLRQQNLDEVSAEEKISKTMAAINSALDKIEQFLRKRG